MLGSMNNNGFELINPKPEHFSDIQALCKKVYPFSKPWSIEQLQSHQTYFPEGQLIVIEKETQRVVGLAFSLIIFWDDYLHQDNWKDFTAGGFFHNHNPKKGKTLYGAEVMVDPEFQGRGIGKLLYKGRQEIVKKYKLKRIRAGARLRGYSKFADRLNPTEYVKQVVAKTIYDPTLSFQLSHGFVVLDVAKNYLFSDPESLGYAAVIEWLNPEVVTEKDLKKQKDSVQRFLENQTLMLEFLPRELRRLVRKMTISLGHTISECESPEFYEKIDYYRQQLKRGRNNKDGELLSALLKKLETEPKKNRLKIAHAFSLLMELMNVCETAYRTWREQHKNSTSPESSKIELNFVLTAHPTEARSPQVVEILRSLTQLLIEGLQSNFVFNDNKVSSYLRLLWRQPLVKTQTPSVLDEANYIFSLIFAQPIFDFIVNTKPSYDLKIRTWVGGDKDGHPGVNQIVMRECLCLSRKQITQIIDTKLNLLIDDLKKITIFDKKWAKEISDIQKLLARLSKLNTIRNSDGPTIKKWQEEYFYFLNRAGLVTKKHHEVLLINQILKIFPAMVMPIELREDASEINRALKNKNASISLMLSELKNISNGHMLTEYVKGFVISNCESASNITDANDLVRMRAGTKSLPIIPLFETGEALLSARKILNSWAGEIENQRQVLRYWGGNFEVMLGYSDSAKKLGSLASRYLIRNAMFEIETILKKYKLNSKIFHGSGGSVARGGGSLREQIAWWSSSAIQSPKLTIQGEMIQRIFATKEILNSQCLHLSNEARIRKTIKYTEVPSVAFKKFVNVVQTSYQDLISNQTLLARLMEASPHGYLNLLKIGSRPSKRPGSVVNVSSLRAIPWVLCWTQNRLLMPSWWGVGTAWRKMSEEERNEIKSLFKVDAFTSSYVKTLGFTLAKVELHIWEKYILEKKDKNSAEIIKAFKSEYELAKKFVFEMSGTRHLIWYRPWLEESIKIRSPYIHILNLLQILSMREGDEQLLKETLVGIACGMLTAG